MRAARSSRNIVALLVMACVMSACRSPGSIPSSRSTGDKLCKGWSAEQVAVHHRWLGRLGDILRLDLDSGSFPTVSKPDPKYFRALPLDDERVSRGACSETGVLVAEDHIGMSNDAYAFSSWAQMRKFVRKKSWAANTEYDRRTTHNSSPDDHRTPSVGGDPYRTLYCLYTFNGVCESWNLIAIAGPCRPVLVDLRLDKPLSEQEATTLLTHVADLWLKSAETDLASFPCQDYGGTPEPVMWKPVG
jgi:hypothetical protein